MTYAVWRELIAKLRLIEEQGAMTRLICFLVRLAEKATGTTWPQWPLWLQCILMKIT